MLEWVEHGVGSQETGAEVLALLLTSVELQASYLSSLSLSFFI